MGAPETMLSLLFTPVFMFSHLPVISGLGKQRGDLCGPLPAPHALRLCSFLNFFCDSRSISVHLVADPALLLPQWDVGAFIVFLLPPALGKLF